jgi:hypothetical protein
MSDEDFDAAVILAQELLCTGWPRLKFIECEKLLQDNLDLTPEQAQEVVDLASRLPYTP